MADELEPMRLVLLIQCFATLGMYGWHFGRTWLERGWARRTFGFGLLGLLAYVGIGQIKGSIYAVPVDAVTCLGAFALTLMIVGLVAVRRFGHEGA